MFFAPLGYEPEISWFSSHFTDDIFTFSWLALPLYPQAIILSEQTLALLIFKLISTLPQSYSNDYSSPNISLIYLAPFGVDLFQCSLIYILTQTGVSNTKSSLHLSFIYKFLKNEKSLWQIQNLILGNEPMILRKLTVAVKGDVYHVYQSTAPSSIRLPAESEKRNW